MILLRKVTKYEIKYPNVDFTAKGVFSLLYLPLNIT